MNDSHRRHLYALLVQLEDTVHRITQAGWMGISPSGGGQRLTPLPEAQWRPLQDALDRLVRSYRDVLQPLVPELTGRHDQPEPLETTCYWLRFLLSGLRDALLPELDPERIERRYGALSEEERQALRRLQHTIERELHHVQQVADTYFPPKR
ncbi:MAG: hypothetical protein NZ520_06215 [bacterium]|nr:hypothetical protein [bacterium]